LLGLESRLCLLLRCRLVASVLGEPGMRWLVLTVGARGRC